MGYLILVALFLTVACAVGPYVLGGALALATVFAFFVGAVEYVTAALAGFTPYGPTTHLRVGPAPESEDGPDPAYRSYYAGPVLLDYRTVLAKTFEQVWAKIVMGKPGENTGVAAPSYNDRLWQKLKNSTMPKAVTVPIAVATTGGLVLGAVAAVAFVSVASAIFLVLLLAVVLGALLTAGTTRIVELAVLFVRGITLECPSCNDKVTRPIYRCPECDAAHRGLVPSTQGVLHRTCRCHTTLPTLLMLGKAKLRGQCPKCQSMLPIKGFAAPTVHIPVIAGPSAGKSVFMHTAVSRLMLGDNEFEFADEGAKQSFETNVQLGVHADPHRAAKTVTKRPRAYNVYVGQGRARRLLYLYDPAGEVVESADHLADTQFLRFTKGIVFIVDPFSLRQVRSETDRAVLGTMHASNTSPKEVLERFVEALREKGFSRKANRITIPVAVVLTKADGLLDRSGAGHPYRGDTGPEAVRTWLADAGQRDLVSSLDNHFSLVSYFVVSYQDARKVSAHGSVVNDDPASPVLWLLNRKDRT